MHNNLLSDGYKAEEMQSFNKWTFPHFPLHTATLIWTCTTVKKGVVTVNNKVGSLIVSLKALFSHLFV